MSAHLCHDGSHTVRSSQLRTCNFPVTVTIMMEVARLLPSLPASDKTASGAIHTLTLRSLCAGMRHTGEISAVLFTFSHYALLYSVVSTCITRRESTDINSRHGSLVIPHTTACMHAVCTLGSAISLRHHRV